MCVVVCVCVCVVVALVQHAKLLCRYHIVLLIPRKSERVIVINVETSSHKVPIIHVRL